MTRPGAPEARLPYVRGMRGMEHDAYQYGVAESRTIIEHGYTESLMNLERTRSSDAFKYLMHPANLGVLQQWDDNAVDGGSAARYAHCDGTALGGLAMLNTYGMVPVPATVTEPDMPYPTSADDNACHAPMTGVVFAHSAWAGTSSLYAMSIIRHAYNIITTPSPTREVAVAWLRKHHGAILTWLTSGAAPHVYRHSGAAAGEFGQADAGDTWNSPGDTPNPGHDGGGTAPRRGDNSVRHPTFAEYLDYELGQSASSFEAFLREWPTHAVELRDGHTPSDGSTEIPCLNPCVAFTYVSGIQRGVRSALRTGPACHCPHRTSQLRTVLQGRYSTLTEWQNTAIDELDDAVHAAAVYGSDPTDWTNASRPVKRNIVMALCFSRSNDDLHCQSLLGVSNSDGVQALEIGNCVLEHDRRYNAEMHGLRSGLAGPAVAVHASWEGKILRPDVVGAGAHYLGMPSDTEAHVVATLDAYRRGVTDPDDEIMPPRDRLYVSTEDSTTSIPVLHYNGNTVIDMRPDMVISGVYYADADSELRYATTNDVYEQLTLDDTSDSITVIYDGLVAVRSTFQEGAQGQRYRKVHSQDGATEPDANLRLRNLQLEPLRNKRNYRATSTGDHPRHILRAHYEPWSSFAIGEHGDGTRGSFDQLRHRYGNRDGRSILGIPLPTCVRDIQFPVSMAILSSIDSAYGSLRAPDMDAGATTDADAIALITTGGDPRNARLGDSIMGMGAYGPLPYIGVDVHGVAQAPSGLDARATYPEVRATAAASAIVAPLFNANYPIAAGRQVLHNATTAPEDIHSISSRLARRGRRNEIGIAMQKIEPGHQGDVMLHDGM